MCYIAAMEPGYQDNTPALSEPDWRNALRREMVTRRAALPPDQHAALSARLCDHLTTLLTQVSVASAAFCWPIKNEADIRPAMIDWIQQGIRIALPVVVEVDAPLAFRTWTPQTVLTPDRYGIPTPADGDWLTPEALLLPLNAFDNAGYRLGYGGGYFDRTLAALAPKPLAIGIGFELNRVASIRPQTHDQRLDWIVTEAGARQTCL